MLIKFHMLGAILGIVLISCSKSNSKESVKTISKRENDYEYTNQQIQFVHLFCNERVVLKDQKDSILFDNTVTSPNCSHVDSSENWYFELPKGVTLIKINLPNRQYLQKIKCRKNNNISLYFHDGSKYEYRKGKDTILVDFWKCNNDQMNEW